MTSTPPTATTHVIAGSVMLTDVDGWAFDPNINPFRVLPEGVLCFGWRGYEDVNPGAAVTVFDESGTVIGAGALGTGRVSEDMPLKGALLEPVPPPGAGCSLGFTIEAVPVTKFYRFEIGHRRGPSYSYADMEESGWTPALALG